MTPLVAVRTDQEWLGFVIVLGIFALCLLVGWGEGRDWFRAQDANLQRLVDDALARVEPDHVDCANPVCDQTVCRCRKPAECTGTTTLGCEHEGLCWDCRLGCIDCAAELEVERAAESAAGR